MRVILRTLAGITMAISILVVLFSFFNMITAAGNAARFLQLQASRQPSTSAIGHAIDAAYLGSIEEGQIKAQSQESSSQASIGMWMLILIGAGILWMLTDISAHMGANAAARSAAESH